MPVTRTSLVASTVLDKTGYTLTAGSYKTLASACQRAVQAFTSPDTSLQIGGLSSFTTTRASQTSSQRGTDNSNNRVLFTTQITGAGVVTAVRDTGGVTGSNVAVAIWEVF